MNLKTEILSQLAEAETLININKPKAAKVRIAFIRRAIKAFPDLFSNKEVDTEELCRLWSENRKD